MKFSLVTVLAVAFSDVQSTQAFVSGKPPKELVPWISPGGYVTAFQRVGEKNLYFELENGLVVLHDKIKGTKRVIANGNNRRKSAVRGRECPKCTLTLTHTRRLVLEEDGVELWRSRQALPAHGMDFVLSTEIIDGEGNIAIIAMDQSILWSPDMVVDGDVSQEIIDFLESFSWA